MELKSVQTHFSHLQVNIDPANLGFYRDLFGFLGWTPIMENESMIGLGSGGAESRRFESLWFIAAANGSSNDYDGAGMNHIGISADSQSDIDATAAYLGEHGVAPLFETPRHRPDFAGDEDQTYYQVMFESPDRVLFEVVYTGPKT